MNTSTFAATLSALTPGKMKGAKASANSSAISSAARMRLRGRSLDRRRCNIGCARSAVGHGIDALRAPQQYRHHQENGRELRERGQQKAHVVVDQAHQQRPDERAA